MNINRRLLVCLLLIIFFALTLQQQQACFEGGVMIPGIHSGIVKFPYDDLNEGSINKNYFEQIEMGALMENSRFSVAFSIVSFEGSGRQAYYALMLKQYTLQNQNTRLSIMMDFQYPNSNLLSVWTQISLSYLIVSENLQRNGYSYVWTFMRQLELKSSVDDGIVEGDLFNHPNDKGLCGYDGRYWHTDGCNSLQAVVVYHCYVSGWKFDPAGIIGIRELAFSVQLVDKKGGVTSDEKEENLEVIFNRDKRAGPRMKIENFETQLQKIKVSLVMSVIQTNSATYPIGTFYLTYSGIYFFEKTALQGQKIISQSKTSNIYHFELPGIKYHIYGISRFVASKGLPRQASIMLSSQIQSQKAIYFEHNFRRPQNQIIFSADFYYKRIDKICQSDNELSIVEKNRISQMKFENFPSNDSSLIIRAVDNGDMLDTEHQIAIEYLYYPSPEIQQNAWVTYTFSNIKQGGSYIFYLSINEIGKSGITDYTGYQFAVNVNHLQIYRTVLIGSPKNDKVQGIQKAMNIKDNSISVKIYTKIYRQQSINVHFRVNLMVKQISKLFNPITQCCTSVCPPQSGLNISAVPMQCIICNKSQGFYFNQKHNSCSCMKGHYFLEETIFPKCLLCEGALCDMCEPKEPKKCIECIFGAQLDFYYRTCKCLSEFRQVENKCLLNAPLGEVCIKYGYCDINAFNGLVYRPGAVNCPDGHFDNGEGSCSKCNSQCLTCFNITSCLTCDQNAHRVLKNNICVCKDGYFPFEYENKTRQCIKCAPQCQNCLINAQSCTECDREKFMEKVITPKGFFTCECIPGYHPDEKGNCIQSNCNTDKFCATCEENKLCTSCIKSSKRILQLPQHICVCMEGYFENQNGECDRCKSGCVKCNSSNVCQDCVISAKKNKDGSCSCPNGTFFNFNTDTNVGFCRKCPSTCEACTNENSCLSCVATYILSPEKKCICPISSFIGQNSTCTQCFEGCAKCNSLKDCVKCKEFYHLEEGYCVRNCRMGFYKTETSCFKCSQGCGRCQNSLVCQACEPGYIFHQLQCHKQCPEGTLKSINQLTNQTSCIPCNSPCKTCMYHPSNCISCQTGKGYLQQVQNEMKCLRQCPQGTFPSKGVCQICDMNCLSCLGDKSNCVECAINQYLFRGRCHKECPGVLYFDTCTNFCPDGYYRLEDKKCWQCSHKCLTCDGNVDDCTSCWNGNFLKGNQCVTQCGEKEFQQKGKCIKCSALCKTCFGNSRNCTSCQDNFKLRDGKCQINCPKNEYFSSQQLRCLNCSLNCKKCLNMALCVECQPEFTLENDQCKNKCSFPCLTCLQKNQCSFCVTGFQLIQKQKQCIQFCPKGMRAENGICKCAYGFYFNRSCETTCPQGFFGNNSSKICEQCIIQNCSKCIAQNICQTCQPSFYLSPDKNKCLKEKPLKEIYPKCPEGFTQQNQGCIKICSEQNFNQFSTAQNGSICIYGSYLSQKQSKATNSKVQNLIKCIQNLVLENGQCKQKCSIGYFVLPKIRECKKCKQPCLTCTDESICLLCKNGYHLMESFCLPVQCQGTRKFFNGKCMNQCPKGTYFDGKICSEICPSNHFLYEGFCYTQCPDQSPFKTDFICLQKCPKGFELKGKDCI